MNNIHSYEVYWQYGNLILTIGYSNNFISLKKNMFVTISTAFHYTLNILFISVRHVLAIADLTRNFVTIRFFLLQHLTSKYVSGTTPKLTNAS